MKYPFKVIYSGALPAQPQSNRIVLRWENRAELASDAVQLEDYSRMPDQPQRRYGQTPKPPLLAAELESFMQAKRPPQILHLAKKPQRFFVASHRKRFQLKHVQSCEYKVDELQPFPED